MTLVYVAIGSNLGDRLDHLRQAAKDLQAISGCKLLAMSSIYETAPMGPQNQPEFLNAVCAVRCSSPPVDLLTALKGIERSHGRIEVSERWTARPLDLDILLYGQRIVISRRLRIPHIGIAKRSFVLWPLLELDANLTIPGCGPAAELRRWCDELGIRHYAKG